MIWWAAIIPLWHRSDATQKTDKANPKWFMVDVKFISRAANFVPYPLLRDMAAGQSTSIEYIREEDMKAIKGNSFMRQNGVGPFCHT
jgi:hypothetical protein